MKALLCFLIALLPLSASAVNISGRVTDADGEPLAEAAVREKDSHDRVVNQVRTDQNGYFTLQLRSVKNTLEVSLDGYLTHSEDIGAKRLFHIALARKATATASFSVARRHTVQTDKLLVGHAEGREVPQQTWIDQYNDTLVEIIVPVQAVKMVDEYPAGRALRFYAGSTTPLAEARTEEDAYPRAGDPADLDSPFWARMRRGDASVAIHDGQPEVCYFYPRFLLTTAALRRLADAADTVISLTADNDRGDNTYMFYPAATFAKELRRYVKKIK